MPAPVTIQIALYAGLGQERRPINGIPFPSLGTQALETPDLSSLRLLHEIEQARFAGRELHQLRRFDDWPARVLGGCVIGAGAGTGTVRIGHVARRAALRRSR